LVAGNEILRGIVLHDADFISQINDMTIRHEWRVMAHMVQRVAA
jgi:hypothetical protein